MSNKNEHRSMIPGIGLGFNARESEPKDEPTHDPEPAAPSKTQYTGRQRELPLCTRPELLPFAKQISACLGDSMARQRLEDAVVGGFLSASEAEEIARGINLNPDRVK
jgi:hypothetical protein